MTQHAIVFIDHDHCKIFQLDGDKPSAALATKAQHKRGQNEHSTAGFFDDVAKSLAGTAEILIVGPGTAKKELAHHLEKHHKALWPHVVAVETVDHPTDNQLKALARQKFKAIDQWL